LRYPESIEELHRNISTGARRFVILTLYIDRVLSLLDPKVSCWAFVRTAWRRGRRWRGSGSWWSRTTGLWTLRERGVRKERRYNGET
jgi:hypothetical protein